MAAQNTKTLQKTKRQLKHRFWQEICDGAKLFYFSGLINGRYPKREVLNLARFISVRKLRPLTWKNTHASVLVDRCVPFTLAHTLTQALTVCASGTRI